jgi:hypothetical protein
MDFGEILAAFCLLKCLSRSRCHHLLKTFWGGSNGWRDRQQPDGDVVWTSPSGQSHTTQPGSRLLFPSLCLPTAPVTVTDTDAPVTHTAGLTMPRRKTTRAQDRRQRNGSTTNADATKPRTTPQRSTRYHHSEPARC